MKVKVCTWKMCSERFSPYILTRLENDKKTFNLNNLEIESSLCMWKCKVWPNVMIENECASKMNPFKTSELVFKKLKK